MTRLPREPLDAEERALAAALPRPSGRTEPDAALDARILAAAHAAANPTASTPRRRSWVMPLSVAASVTLAFGLAWQLRPLAMRAPMESTAASAPVADEPQVQMIEAPPAPEATESAPAPMVAQPKPMPDRIVTAPTASAEPVAAAPPPPAPPAPAAAAVMEDMAPVPVEVMATPASPPQAAPQAAAMAKSTDSARERAATAGMAARRTQLQQQDQRNEAAKAAEAAALDVVSADDPGEDVPPATADSPEVRDAWLHRIGELLKQGRTEDAKDSLAEFKRRYPDATLPPELRKLDP